MTVVCSFAKNLPEGIRARSLSHLSKFDHKTVNVGFSAIDPGPGGLKTIQPLGKPFQGSYEIGVLYFLLHTSHNL